METFQPYWPETIFFIGAGATAPLGMATTKGIGESITILTNEKIPLKERIRLAYQMERKEILEEMMGLFLFFEDQPENSVKYGNTIGFNRKRRKELLQIFDWPSLKKMTKRCPRHDKILSTQDLFNLIDMSIQSKQGVYVDNEFIPPERMKATRNMLVLLISLLHKVNYLQSLQLKSSLFDQYYGFAKILTELMVEEGLKRAREYELNERAFYLFSYAIINMNWDPLFLWFIFNAHKEWNDQKEGTGVGKKYHVPLKLFNDMAHFMAVRSVEETTPEAWFPLNETAVLRLNNEEHVTDRRVRIGKFYFPHGSHGFRECPNCGKLTFFLGNEWKVKTDSLFPPSIIPSLAKGNRPKSIEEKRAYEEGAYDALQCPHCGSLTYAYHTPIIMQTNFKGSYPPYIEEIQRDMKVAVSKAKHIILFGYSLPSDDIQYRSMLAAKKNDGVKCSLVNFHEHGPDQWLYGDDLKQFIQSHPHDSVSEIAKQVIDLFGKEHVRAYLAGIPKVFTENNHVSRKKVEQLLHWDRG
ncbi:hypothetical protein [Fervidibacillus halotolerans]|uniref:Uncharacterized protein n=1 Tax=Fervidibacillus halotolerans TaxID=2980027 RepID=A0A9E8LZ92_9BACI|nr:hypothetical protein [Fervidibacillus halotolerans]WAA12020.1 hypothetical protein OE105_10595 [Fervidibacillus halotolerans]